MGDHSYQLDLYKSSQPQPLPLPSPTQTKRKEKNDAEESTIRIGIVSRFFVSMHPVGIFTQVLLVNPNSSIVIANIKRIAVAFVDRGCLPTLTTAGFTWCLWHSRPTTTSNKPCFKKSPMVEHK